MLTILHNLYITAGGLLTLSLKAGFTVKGQGSRSGQHPTPEQQEGCTQKTGDRTAGRGKVTPQAASDLELAYVDGIDGEDPRARLHCDVFLSIAMERREK